MNLDDLTGDSCAFCGASIEHMRVTAKYCSPKCRRADLIRLDREARIESHAGRTCADCGSAISPAMRADAVYCSKRCSSRASHKRWAKRVRREAKAGRVCRQCGGAIPIEVRAGAVYCTRACGEAWESAMRIEARALWKKLNGR